MQEMKVLNNADVRGKRVLVRVDYNVPLKDGRVLDDSRIRATLPTLRWLTDRGAAVVLLTSIGRPEGKVVEELRTAPLKGVLDELLPGNTIELRENLRFDPREERNDEGFAKELAALGDLFVNDAFADAHRAHASIVGIPKFLPSCAGLLMQREVEELSHALIPPPRSIAILGGSKFETKLPLIKKLLAVYSEVLLGGALGNDLIKARGLPFGASLVSQEPVPTEVASDERVVMPQDAVATEEGHDAERSLFVSDIRATESIVDIGPKTRELWSKKIADAPFVLWNGPVGVYERGFADGTRALAAALVASSARAVIGGGDTDAVLRSFAFDPARIFLSTGGGAMLEFLENGTLPGITALERS